MSAFRVALSWRNTSGAAHSGVQAPCAVLLLAICGGQQLQAGPAGARHRAVHRSPRQPSQACLLWSLRAAAVTAPAERAARCSLSAQSLEGCWVTGKASQGPAMQLACEACNAGAGEHLSLHESHVCDLGHALAGQQHIWRPAPGHVGAKR